MSVKERIKIFVEYQKMTVSAFEKSINASNGYVNSISKSIGLDKIELILENYPKLNIEWLLTGKGSMLKSEEKSRLSQNITGNSNTQSGNDTNITGNSSQQVNELQKQLKERDKEIERLKAQVDKLFKMIP